LILLALSTNVWYCCTNQFYVQSCLGAKDEWHGRMGVLLTAFLGPVLTLCFAFPGYIAADLIQQGKLTALPAGGDGLPDANAAYPHLVGQLLGPGLRGFLVAAVLGAIMSTVSSIVNATASVFTVDFYQRCLRPGAGDGELVRVGRLAGVLTLLAAFPLTFVALEYRYIFIYSQSAWCILAIPIMVVFTLGMLWARATERAATATFLLALPFVAVPFVFGNSEDSWLSFWPGAPRVHLFVFAFGLGLATAAFMAAVSFLSPAPPAAVSRYLWRPGRGRLAAMPEAAPQPWYSRVSLWCAAAGILYLVIYLKLW
jgi:SSS family solute:Na+ symporter